MLKSLEQFGSKKILIVGDLMLDRYLTGDVQRVSPEAPVPVIDLQSERLIPGGAANVALNVAGLGANAVIAGFTGNDQDGALLQGLIDEEGISSEGIFQSVSRKTTVKTRLMAHSQQIARVDSESVEDLNAGDLVKLVAFVEAQVGNADALIVSDYGKGVVSSECSSRIIEIARKNGVPVYVDPKGVDYSKYNGATLLTPNKKESHELYLAESRREGTVEQAGRLILEKFEIEELLITLGAEGMALFRKGATMERLKASERNVYDVTGAGDTVIATLALAKSAGADLGLAAIIANAAAGIVIEKVGTTAIRIQELKDALLTVEKREVGI